MTRYRLNGLDDKWIWDAESEEQATADYLQQVGGFETIAEYEEYCLSVGVDPKIEWSEEK